MLRSIFVDRGQKDGPTNAPTWNRVAPSCLWTWLYCVWQSCQLLQALDQLSEVLYKNRGASYLQLLTSETQYFSSELNLVQAQLNERLALAAPSACKAAIVNGARLAQLVVAFEFLDGVRMSRHWYRFRYFNKNECAFT